MSSTTSAPIGAVGLASFRVSPGRITLPDVTCNLIWVRQRLLFAGPLTYARPALFVGEDVCLLAIAPWVARAWTNVPLHRLTDQVLPLGDINDGLHESIIEFFRCDRAGQLLCTPPRTVDSVETRRMARAAASLSAGVSVASMAMSSDLSERQFERLFRDQMGLAPRTFIQISRLRRAVATAKQGETLAAAALKNGYSDQPHFNRATRALTGRSPRGLLPNVGNVQDVRLGEW